MSRQRLNWERLVAQMPTLSEESLPEPPHGLAKRIVGQWLAARRDEVLRRWAKWSLSTAVVSVAACALLAFLGDRQAGSIVVPLPEPPELKNLPLPR